MEAVLTQGVGWLNLSDTSDLVGQSFKLHLQSFVPVMPGHLGGWIVMEWMLCCARQKVVTTSPSFLSCDVLQIKDRIGNPLYHTPCVPDRFVPGKAGGFSSSLSLTQTLWHCWIYSSPPTVLSLSRGVPLPGHTSHRGSHCQCSCTGHILHLTPRQANAQDEIQVSKTTIA